MNSAVSVVKPETVILATEERFVKDEATIMVLNEGLSFNNGSTHVVKDTNKKEYFKCKDKSVAFADGKIFKDMNSVPVIAIKNESLIGFKQEIYNPNKNKKIGKVTKESILSSNCLVVSFYNKATHSSENLLMKFNNGDKSCNIYYGKSEKAPLVGKIQKKSAFIGKDKYYFEIAPKVDVAFMSTLVVAYDAYKHL